MIVRLSPQKVQFLRSASEKLLRCNSDLMAFRNEGKNIKPVFGGSSKKSGNILVTLMGQVVAVLKNVNERARNHALAISSWTGRATLPLM